MYNLSRCNQRILKEYLNLKTYNTLIAGKHLLVLQCYINRYSKKLILSSDQTLTQCMGKYGIIILQGAMAKTIDTNSPSLLVYNPISTQMLGTESQYFV